MYGTKGLTDDSIKLFNEMKKNNITADTVTYNIRIIMFRNKRFIDESIKLFNELFDLVIKFKQTRIFGWFGKVFFCFFHITTLLLTNYLLFPDNIPSRVH